MSKDENVTTFTNEEAAKANSTVENETSNRRAFMTGALAATAGVVAASTMGSKKAEAATATSSMAFSGANFNFLYDVNTWRIQDIDGYDFITGVRGGETSLYHTSGTTNEVKLKTTSDGVDVVGEFTSSGNVGFGRAGTYYALNIWDETSATTIAALGDTTACTLYLQADASNTYVNSRNSYPLHLQTNNTTAIEIDTNQNTSLKGKLSFGSTNSGLEELTGDYGSVQAFGPGTTTWQGYSIAGKYVFMSYQNSLCGIYDDINNKWFILCNSNSHVSLYYDGTEKLRTASTGVAITGVATATDFTATSDRSLKNNFQFIENPLGRLLNLKGYIHSWKAGGEDSFGFIHDEVEAAEPLLAIRNEEGLGSVNYQKVVPLLVEAARELKADHDILRDDKNKEIDELKKKNILLEERLQKLEKLVDSK